MGYTTEYGMDDFGQGGLNEQLDADSLTEDIGLDEEEIQWRKDFVGFDEDDVRRLRSYEESFADNAEQVADDFYDNITDYEETVEIIGRSPKNLDALKRTQSAYLSTLARGSYGEEYFRERARIGKIHDLLDMPMKHYLGQYGVYYDLILPLVGDRLVESLTEELRGVATDGGVTADHDGDAGAADAPSPGLPGELEATIEAEVTDAIEDILSILRIINLDMQVVTDTYIHSYSERLEAEIARTDRLMSEVESDVQQPISDLRDTSEDVTGSATEISEAAGAQSEQITEMRSEVTDLSATVEEVASTADQVESASERARELAEDGRGAADDAVGVMDDIGGAVDEMEDDMDELHARVGEIDDFVETINEIADQTNMLALNASIEAARVGQAGEGFGVVADEIKSLAEESQSQAAEIETMVEEIQADTDETAGSLQTVTEQVDRGIGRVQDSMKSLVDIVGAVEETADGIGEVSDAADDQAAAAEEIAAMFDEIVEQADRVATEVEELAAANQEQSAMVTEVEESVSRLTEDEAKADGGRARPTHDDGGGRAAHDGGGGRDSHDGPSSEAVAIPEDLPDGMPEFVVDMLSDEQLRAAARGELDPSDVI